MFILREITKAIRITLILWLLTAIIYPLVILTVGQFVFPYEANGSIVQNIQGEQIGSALIGQKFTSDRYFRSRPSVVEYSEGKEAKPTGISGASNLAPGNPALMKRISEEITYLKDEGIQPFTDLVYASGSGLDPHISVKAAREQLERVARARELRPDEVLPFINKFTEGRFFGIFGEPGVNVLKLNYALDLDEFNRQQQNR
ncbi:potassium-transporting ATPase subunit C [Scytonema hofmannii PCC 7110]|uniref:Potassium-transporting ATPase KdpC subunit n=1 Tax=Scytonema hofmannii PCC 7110 TaxID=128403 RepID=A0A139X8H6_9CYAN|nr:K(+)-transporting ATPase subunit C [Scytonema hofmannii]KYC41009.1 potassium-transporting ATPase subunit C [Scytonema hofmannii PCC 7110]